MSKIVLTNLGAPPAIPASGTVVQYALGNVLYSMNDVGTITSLGGGGGSVTINTNLGSGLAGGGTGSLFTLSLGFPGQAAGDVIYCTGAGWAKLPIGTAGQVLTVIAGLPSWQPAGGGGITLAGVAGQGINVGSAPNYTLALSVSGQVPGAIIYRDGSNNWVALPPGTAGQVLTLTGGLLPSWAPGGGGGAVTINTPVGSGLTGGAVLATTFNLAFGFAGQADGDMAVYQGPVPGPAGWRILPRGVAAAPRILADGGGPAYPATPTTGVQWVSASAFSNTYVGGNGTAIGPGNSINISFPGESGGDMIFNNAGTWDRLAAGPVLAGYVLKVGPTGIPTWDLDLGVTDLYVSSTGSDTNDGLTALTPFQTLHRAMRAVPRVGLGRQCTIHCVGTGNITADEPGQGVPAWMIPNGGPLAKMLTIDSDLKMILAGQTATTGAQGGGNVFGTLTATGTPWTANAFRGKILRVTAAFGVTVGTCFRIHDNTTSTITICGPLPVAFVPNWTFDIVEELVIDFNANVFPEQVPTIMGGPLLLSGVRFNFADNNAVIQNASIYLNAASLGGTGTLNIDRSKVSAIRENTSVNVRGMIFTTTLNDQLYCGPLLTNPTILSRASDFDLYGVRLESALLGFDTSGVNLTAVSFGGSFGSVQVKKASKGDINQGMVAGSSYVGALITVSDNSYGGVVDVNFNSAGGVALVVEKMSSADVSGLVGTVGGLVAVQVMNHGRVRANDANTGTTVVGSSNAVKVGNNAATTWALILAGATADVVDLAASPPTFSAITT